MLLSLFLLSTANAQPRDAGRIAAGEDIVAWRALSDEPSSDELEAFVQEFPSSPLAQRAALELDTRGEALPELNALAQRSLASSVDRNAASLRRQASGVSVATVYLDDEPGPVTRNTLDLTPTAEIGWMGAAQGNQLYLSAGVQRSHLGVSVRGSLGSPPAELGLSARARLRSEGLTPYAEGIVNLRDPGLLLAVGLLYPFDYGLSLSVAAEMDLNGKQGAMRAGLVKTF